MAKKPVKETITPPKKTLLTRESAKLRRGDPAAGRILSEAAQAARQKKGPKKR